jgi:hypothetical protein
MMKKVCACGGGVGGHLQVIIMSPKQSLGDILCLLRFLLLLLFFLSFFFLLPKVYPIHFSATTERKSMRCGCCSYQVSSISVWRVTRYDNFCVFQFLSILAVSMAMAAILKNPKVVCTSTHSA